MKRLHVSLGVDNLEESVQFYNALFNAEPEVLKSDYAKWSLTDPSVNFTIQVEPTSTGVKHLGIEAGSKTELKEIYANNRKGRRGQPKGRGPDHLLLPSI